MALVKKKILPEYFDAIASGKKTYELRLGDMVVAEGDTLLLQEWNENKKEYTGREISKEVTYVRKFMIDQLYWPQEEIMKKGLVVISIK
jgi:ASC-1-like (ASCH) protein